MQNSVEKVYKFLWQRDSFGSLSQLLECKLAYVYFVFSTKFTLNLKVSAENISITKKSIRGSFMPSPLTAIYLLKHLISFNFFTDILKYNVCDERWNILLFYVLCVNI